MITTKLIQDGPAWDRFLDGTPYGTIFHRWRFLKIIEKHSPYTLLPYGIYRGNELICLFPLYFRAYRGLKLVFSPPPQMLVPYLGPVMGATYGELKQKRREAYLADAIRTITAEMRKISPNYMKMLTQPCFDDVRPFRWQHYAVDISYDYVIDLARPLQEIWAGFDSTCKKQIKHVQGRGLEMRRSADPDAFYRIMEDNFTAKGLRSPYHGGDSGYLKEILDAYPDNVKMYFLYEGEKVVGAHVVCKYHEKCTLWLGSATGNYNEFMLWELMKLEKSGGMKTFEIQDADTPRVLPFKSKFNPGLEHKFQVNRKDALGSIAEWAFNNILKGWI